MDNKEFYWVRDKKTGRVSRVSALPYMGQNSNFELAEDPRPIAKSALPKAGDELSEGLTDGEDGS